MRTFALALGIGAFCVAAAAPSVHAATITPAGDTFTIDFKGTDQNVNDDAFLEWLTSTATFTVQPWVDDTVTIQVALANTTDTASGYGSVITSFGFNVSPAIESGEASAGSLFEDVYLDASINAHGLGVYIGGAVDLCVTNNANCTGGNPNNGLAAGDSGSVTLTLRFADPPQSITLDKFFVRYQALTFNGDRFGSGSGAGIACTGLDDEDCYEPPCEGPNCPGDPVPEPTTVALLGLGFLSVGVAARRRR